MTGTPRETGTPNSFRTALAWYSWMFMGEPRRVDAHALSSEQAAKRPSQATQARSAACFDWLASRLSMTTLPNAHAKAGLMPLQASTSVFTEATDLANMSRSSLAHLDLEDALDAAVADHHRHADIHALHVVFAVEIGGAGQHALLVLEVALGHGDGRGGRRIEGRAGLEQVDDLAAALAGALDDGVDAARGWSSPS